MYIVLTGAKKNVGDYLIRDRSLKLLKHLKPNDEIVEYNSWEPLDDRLNTINKSKGIIICGGPGYKQDVYPNVYPLTKNLDDIKVPIYILGAGWYGITGDQKVLENYKFTPLAMKFLKKASEYGGLSCRDYYTKRVLINNGIEKVSMTGCPVMYNIPYLNRPLRKPNGIENIVFTTPQDPIYTDQCIELMKSLRAEYKTQNIYASFHRGVGRGEGTGYLEGINLEKMHSVAKNLGFEVIDASGDLSKMDFYSEMDLHIGYRVHAHLFFLSERKPSFLINEDGRGLGFCKLLGLDGINAYKEGHIGGLSTQIQNRTLKKFYNKSLGYTKAKKDISKEVVDFMNEEIHNDFVRFSGIDTLIDANFLNMKKFIETI